MRTDAMTKPSPVADPDRILFWDVLRGVAVLGVLLANMPLMSFGEGMTFDPYPLGPEESVGDHLAFAFVRIFADTKFITIFSILFGAGLGIMSEKAVADGDRPFAGLYLRRLALLAGLGIIHAHFIWFGDILLHYAIIGCAALLFRRIQPQGLATIAVILLLLCFGWNLLLSLPTLQPPLELTMEEQAADYNAIYSSGDFLRMRAARTPFALMGTIFMGVAWGMRTLGLFLLGMALVKSGIFVNAESRRGLFKKVAIAGLALGLPLSAFSYFHAEQATRFGGHEPATSDAMLHSASLYLSAIFQSPAYISIVALWTMSGVLHGLRDRLAAVGRMALTNYLSHSIITAVIFNYLGYFGAWGRGKGLLLCFAIFAFQLVVSPIWLRAFRFGPVEWLWRSATYGQRQAMRR
jgi:uncharacterized protein